MAENNEPRLWFSRLIPVRVRNRHLTLAEKKAKVERECKELLKDQSDGEWIMVPDPDGFKWERPDPDDEQHRYKLTTWIKLKRVPKPGEPGPGDPPIPARRNPPPSM
jgi:hypothetical protein